MFVGGSVIEMAHGGTSPSGPLRQVVEISEIFESASSALIGLQVFKVDERDGHPIDNIDDPCGEGFGKIKAGRCCQDFDPKRWISQAGDLIWLQEKVGRDAGLTEPECLKCRDGPRGVCLVRGNPDVHVARSTWIPVVTDCVTADQ